MKKIVILLLSSIPFAVQSQELKPKNGGAANVVSIEGVYLGFGIPTSDDVELYPQLNHIVPANASSNPTELSLLKAAKLEEKKKAIEQQQANEDIQNQESSMKKTRAFEPIKEVGYNAIGATATPPDNTIAVNEDNVIICMVNSTMRRYSAATGVGIASTTTLSNFFATPQNGTLLTSSVCDPKVIFDPESKRFIAFAQTCQGNSATSQLLFAFSKGSDPALGWYFYAFSGNPSASVGQNVWFDYPKIAVSNSDVFVTGNMFNNNKQYVESVVYQINKVKCYAGNTLANNDVLLWYNLDNNPFTLVPMSNGMSGGYGNNMYLACTKQSGSTKRIGLFEITNSTNNNPQMTAELIPTDTISSPADAIQNGSSVVLDIGDNRGMDGFYLNGTIHYVFHCDVGQGYSGINYSRITKTGNQWTLKRRIIKIAGKDLGFPSIASFGYTPNDQSSIIGFNYASSSDFPGMKAIYIDNNMIPSAPIEIKSGTGYASVLTSGGKTRWGDYSGLSRVLNASKPTAWHFGMFGNTLNTWTNYFAKITTQGWPLATNEIIEEPTKAIVYPNPVVDDHFKVMLTLEQAGIIEVQLLDINGQIIRKIFSSPALKGENLFSIYKGNLATGTYVLQFSLDQKIIQNETISVIHP